MGDAPGPACLPASSCTSAQTIEAVLIFRLHFYVYTRSCTCRESNRRKKIRNHSSVCSFIREELCGGCRPKLFAKTLRSLWARQTEGYFHRRGRKRLCLVRCSPAQKLWQSNWLSHLDRSTGNPDYPLFPFSTHISFPALSSSSSGGLSRTQIAAQPYSPLTCISGCCWCQFNYLRHGNLM